MKNTLAIGIEIIIIINKKIRTTFETIKEKLQSKSKLVKVKSTFINNLTLIIFLISYTFRGVRIIISNKSVIL